MLNDRDDKNEGHEESEYHFSDDEVSYEVEPETTTTPKASVPGLSKEGIFNRLSSSKRMLLSLVVFLVLVFIVYKMVSPTGSTPPATDISPAVATQSPQTKPPTSATVPGQAPVSQPVASAATNLPPATPQLATPPTVAQPNVATTLPARPQPATAPIAQPQPPLTGTPTIAEVPSAVPPTMPVAQPQLAREAPSQPGPPVAQVPSQPGQPSSGQPSGQTTITTVQTTPPSGVVAEMPAVIPVAQVPATLPQNNAAIDASIAAIASNNAKLINQLEAEYAQKVNDFTAQSKTMQDQLQALNARVASMETQMNQLVRALTHQRTEVREVRTTVEEAPPPSDHKFSKNSL